MRFRRLMATFAAAAAPASTDPAPPPAETKITTALDLARALTPPQPTATHNGELEHSSFWEDNQSTLRSAIKIYGPKDSALYTYCPSLR